MTRHIYGNNSVEITSETIDHYECKINVNEENLIWISANQEDNFRRELSEVLDKYRI